MRGVSGSGKSTKAKSFVGQGVIHSTDDLIKGDYKEFFAKMIEKNDFTPLKNLHIQNTKNALEAINAGVSPVIQDNTNIKHSEAKDLVFGALQLGLADDNIKFIDIGTAGLEAEELAKRNTHNVSLDIIKTMIDNYTKEGPITLKSVLSSK